MSISPLLVDYYLWSAYNRKAAALLLYLDLECPLGLGLAVFAPLGLTPERAQASRRDFGVPDEVLGLIGAATFGEQIVKVMADNGLPEDTLPVITELNKGYLLRKRWVESG